jgi:hypothetical protein
MNVWEKPLPDSSYASAGVNETPSLLVVFFLVMSKNLNGS